MSFADVANASDHVCAAVTLNGFPALFIFIVYVASLVTFELLSFAVITTLYPVVLAALLAGIVITPALDTVISDSPDFLV